MLGRFTKKLVHRIGVMLEQAERTVAQTLLPKFANDPKNLVIERPRRISHPEFMHMGDDVYLGPNSLLVGVTRYPAPGNIAAQHVEPEKFSPRIRIGNRVNSTGGLQVAACVEIEIGDDVLFATNVNITDAFHGYKRTDLPYKSQPMQDIKLIKIGEGCWIGQNVVILPGTEIGEYAIVGANSVVNGQIPARSIAVGAPARVIKHWNPEIGDWVTAD